MPTTSARSFHTGRSVRATSFQSWPHRSNLGHNVQTRFLWFSPFKTNVLFKKHLLCLTKKKSNIRSCRVQNFFVTGKLARRVPKEVPKGCRAALFLHPNIQQEAYIKAVVVKPHHPAIRSGWIETVAACKALGITCSEPAPDR